MYRILISLIFTHRPGVELHYGYVNNNDLAAECNYLAGSPCRLDNRNTGYYTDN